EPQNLDKNLNQEVDAKGQFAQQAKARQSQPEPKIASNHKRIIAVERTVGCMDAERNAPAPREACIIFRLRGTGALRSASMHPTNWRTGCMAFLIHAPHETATTRLERSRSES